MQDRTSPGVLYYDPSPASAQMTAAALRLAGYRVHFAPSSLQALTIYRQEDKNLVALLLDMTCEPEAAAALVRDLAKLPGASELPTLTIVHPGDQDAADLSRIPRPVRASELLQALRASIEAVGEADAVRSLGAVTPRARLEGILAPHIPQELLTPELLTRLFRVLEESPDLPELSQRPSLWGSLRLMPPAVVLTQLSKIGATGMLSLRGPNDRLAQIFLDEGQVASACLNPDPDEAQLPSFRLGELALARGSCEPAALEQALQDRPATTATGQHLIDTGVLSTQVCLELLREQRRSVVSTSLGWLRGRFSFVSPQPIPSCITLAKAQGLIASPVPPLVLYGLRQRDLQAMQTPQSASFEARFLRNEEAILAQGVQSLDREELELLELLNGRNTLGDAVRKLQTGVAPVLRVLNRLQAAGLVQACQDPVLSP